MEKINDGYTIAQFIEEYDLNVSSKNYFKMRGFEFSYKGNYYRMSIEWGDEYFLYQVHFYKKEGVDTTFYDYTTLGVFYTMKELLNSKIIDNRRFEDIIMDEKTTKLESQD